MQRNTELTDIARLGKAGSDTGSKSAPGDTLAGRFVLHEKLGSGGSGTVWSALDTMVGDRVAVKVLHAAIHDPANRERLRREIRVTRSGHPNLVSIHELHESDGQLFITMELVDGASLRDALAERRSLIIDDVLAIGRQIADALDHLHGQGLVHRDVKPGNIMLAPDGTTKLCDMGLARPMAVGATVTETEMVVGTPVYMAPEMARGGELVAASDVYALGLTLYQCLTGEVPLAGTTAVDTLMARQHRRPRRVRVERPECPRWLDRLLDRMLDPEPGMRPSAAEVAKALDAGRFSWRPHRRHLRRAAAAAVIVLVGATAVGYGLHRWGAPPDPAVDPVANELVVSMEFHDHQTAYNIIDGYGKLVQSLTTTAVWNEESINSFRVRQVDFMNFDDDGRRDIVFGDSDPAVERQLEIHRRLPDGGTELAEAWNIHLEVRYDGEVFGRFTPYDLRCADLSGDGRAEIIVTQRSQPYFPGAVRVFTADGDEVLRVLHPGQPTNVRVGDRDGDGRPELYVGATNNFVAERMGRESSPAVFAVSTDWTRHGQVLDFFAPGREMAAEVPKGMDVVYAVMAKQRILEGGNPWRFAAISELNPTVQNQFLIVRTDRIFYPPRNRYSFIRSFHFDRELRLADAVWINTVNKFGLDMGEHDHPEQLTVSYWNGDDWQPDVCAIPQTED